MGAALCDRAMDRENFSHPQDRDSPQLAACWPGLYDARSLVKGTIMRILVADKLADEGLDYLKSTGIEFDVKVGLNEDQLASAVGEYDALIVRSGAKVTAKVLENPGSLKAIARAGVG